MNCPMCDGAIYIKGKPCIYCKGTHILPEQYLQFDEDCLDGHKKLQLGTCPKCYLNRLHGGFIYGERIPSVEEILRNMAWKYRKCIPEEDLYQDKDALESYFNEEY